MRILTLLLLVLILGCAPQKQTVSLHSSNAGLAKDSVVYYETDFETRQKNYLDQMDGTWTIATMQQQARLDIEPVSGTSISFSKDMHIILRTPCGDFTGRFDIKGTGVRITDLAQNKNMDCAGALQQNTLIHLLQDRVSAYTVSSNELLLRDNATNIVFRLKR